MTRQRLGIIAIVAAVAVLVTAGIVWAVRNYEPTPVARPCLLPPAAAVQEELRAYAAGVSEAETIADETDVVCVLEGSGSTLTMRYYEDDDGFADFLPYALATSHLRHLIKYKAFTGTPDVGQRYALHFLMGVDRSGKITPVYKINGNGWVKDDNPVSHPGALATQVRYGNARTIKIGDAFNQTPPSKYRKGTANLAIGSGRIDLGMVRNLALTPSGKDDDHRTSTRRPSARPSAPPPGTAPSAGPTQGSRRPGAKASTAPGGAGVPTTKRTRRTS